MPAPLRCPTCSAPLDVPPEHATVVRCTYCGAGVLLTERGGHLQAAAQQERHTDAIAEVLRELRAGSKIGAIKVYRERFGVGLAEAKYAVERIEAGQPGFVPQYTQGHTAAGQTERSGPGRSGSPSLAVGCAGLLTLIAAAVGVLAVRREAPEPATPAAQTVPGTPSPTPAPASPVEQAGPPAFAEPVLRFGTEGTGAGRFQDARGVAVDGAGRIYVAEYTGGRVQVFDSAGTFLTQWMADARMPLLDLEAGRDGTVHVVQSGRIRRYEGATGRALGEVRRPGGASVDDVALALDGTLWAVSGLDRIMHLSAEGEVLRTINLKEAVDEDASPVRVAVAGTGDLYVLDRWKSEVYHLDANGRFRDRFAGRSDTPGQGIRAAQALAIDGRGRVFVSDMMTGMHVFDADGRFIESFGRDLNAFGATFNERDELFVSNRNDHEVVKYRLVR